MTTDHLRFSPDILKRLGEELIPNVDQGIVELVRNSYDADATTCKVELIDIESPGGTLRIEDDGLGMSENAIRSGWLVLGRSTKLRERNTPGGRLAVGDKGLGRLAALRMGDIARLFTRPADEPGYEYRLTLDWSRFEEAALVDDVDLEIERVVTRALPGTTIEVEGLRNRLGRREVNRLARALLLLRDPFDDSMGFRPVLVAPAFADLEARVRDSYFDDAEYRLQAEVDEYGHASVRLFDWTGKLRWEAGHKDLARTRDRSESRYNTAPATFELWTFSIGGVGQSYAPRAPVGELRDWLEAVGGVHFYYRGLRVHPYGDAGFDWLEMNLARARDPELRPSTNNSLGQIRTVDLRNELVQKTDRLGFVENEQFSELKRFAIDALEWMHGRRLALREERKKRSRAAIRTERIEAEQSVHQTLQKLPAEDRAEVEKAIQQLNAARDRETQELREDLQLYRTLGTVGTTSAVFAHEAAKPVTLIEQMAGSIERRGKLALGEHYANTIGEPLGVIQSSAQSLRTYAALPLRLLSRDKRRSRLVDVHAVIRDIEELFQPFLRDARIELRIELVDARPEIHGNIAALESILVNFITNAINSFDSERVTNRDRIIVLRTELAGDDRLLIRAMDSGSGISRLSDDEIWLPGRTTKPGGTGLGLTIVRDTVLDLNGRVHVLANGEFGGAEFGVEIPLAVKG